MTDRSLYQRLGGVFVIAAVVDHFSDAVAGELARSLDAFAVPAREKDEVLAAFAAHKAEVTAGSSTVAATA